MNASNHQHVKATRSPKDAAERSHSGDAQNCAGQQFVAVRRQERAVRGGSSEETSARGSGSAKGEAGRINDGDESRGNSGSCSSWECRCRSTANRSVRAAGKEQRYRGKSSWSLAAENRMAMGLLTRSTSCGDVHESIEWKHNNDADAEINSGAESEPGAEVYVKRDHTKSCVECDGESSTFGRYKGVGNESLPDLNRINKEDVKGNQLGLEVMLSLINGPMQSVIDSKDEKIRSLERAVERLECENKQAKHVQKPGDATKIFTLEKTLESCVRQMEQLEEEKKTAHEKVRLLDDLRKNDKECIEMLRMQIGDLEIKLSTSDGRVREVEKERKSQSQRLKQQYEDRVEELQDALRSKDSKLRDFDKIRSRVAKQRQELEDKKESENELRNKMGEQVLELKRDLQLQQTKSNILEKEKKALEDSLSQSENLQRQDQKSSYVLQMKIVELQEKLEASCRKNEELEKQREASNTRCQLLEDRAKKQATDSQACKGTAGAKTVKENQSCAFESARAVHVSIEKTRDACSNALHPKRNEEKFEISGKCPSVLERHVNDVLRERVVELHDKFYKGHERICLHDRSSSDEHVESLSCCHDQPAVDEKWRAKREGYGGGVHESGSNGADMTEGNPSSGDVTSRIKVGRLMF